MYLQFLFKSKPDKMIWRLFYQLRSNADLQNLQNFGQKCSEHAQTEGNLDFQKIKKLKKVWSHV